MSAPDRFKPVPATRIVGEPAALDALEAPEGGYLMRLAPDDLLVLPPISDVDVADRHAIVEPEGGFSGAWFEESESAVLQSVCGWEFPVHRPAFSQGLVAGIPTKLRFTGGGVLALVPTVVVHHMEERLMEGRLRLEGRTA